MPNELASSRETGSLGVLHLKRLWSSAMLERSGEKPERGDEWQKDSLLMDALGLGKLQTMQLLFQSAPGFREFEHWVVETAGRPSAILVERVNAQMKEIPQPESVRQWLDAIEKCPPVLTHDFGPNYSVQNVYQLGRQTHVELGFKVNDRFFTTRLVSTDGNTWRPV